MPLDVTRDEMTVRREKAVLVSVGYPPEVATVSTELDTWKFWRDRFRNYMVYFSNGKVTKSEQ